MKSIFVSFCLMSFLFTSVNNETILNDYCHERACIEVGKYEDYYKDDLPFEAYENVYNNAYRICDGLEKLKKKK